MAGQTAMYVVLACVLLVGSASAASKQYEDKAYGYEKHYEDNYGYKDDYYKWALCFGPAQQ